MFTRKKLEDHDKLLLIFIHGFKGDEFTFQEFPEHLRNALTYCIRDVDTESIVYDRYETKGEFKEAVDMFCSYLERLVQKKEEEISRLEGKGKVWVCLLGHSMGGILAADTVLRYVNREERTSSPNIIGLLAFDSPFYGLHGGIIGNTYDQANKTATGAYTLFSTAATASGFFNSKTSTSKTSTPSKSSGWGKLGVAAAGLLAAAGTAYYHKELLADHYKYVGILLNGTELRKRVNDLSKVENFVFHCFYTQIPQNKEKTNSEKSEKSAGTFIRLPEEVGENTNKYFSAMVCTSKYEISAHISMFDQKQNKSYDSLINMSSKYLCDMVNLYQSMETSHHL